MLVLSRKPGESVRVGPSLIRILGPASAGPIKLAIEAPQDLKITRPEQHETEAPKDP